tara:strand:+ start:392 stop:574 length:183 start_codon:yes stop_codon:yes gene_type:complete
MKTITLPDKGTYTVINKELHFLDFFSKEWESFNKDYEFILTKEEKQNLKNYLGSFEINKN